jgi:hypothetical protein
VTQLIPYQNDNPAYPRNAVGFLGLFPNIKGYLLLYTKADVDVKITPGSSGYEMLNALSRDLYAYIVDSNLTKLTARIKLCSQPSPGGRNYRACFFKNGTYRIEWITNLQMTGQAYTKKWQFFDENMVPVSAVDSVPASDGMSYLVPDYKVFDDSLIIGTRYFSAGSSMYINTLQSLFENPTKNVRAPQCAAGTFGARFSMVMNPGRLTVSSIDRGELRLSIVNCLGRTCRLVTKKGSGVFQIPLRGFSSGVYLVRADLANGMSYRSKIILP